MMFDILKCHQPNKDGIVKMMYRADFYEGRIFESLLGRLYDEPDHRARLP